MCKYISSNTHARNTRAHVVSVDSNINAYYISLAKCIALPKSDHKLKSTFSERKISIMYNQPLSRTTAVNHFPGVDTVFPLGCVKDDPLVH